MRTKYKLAGAKMKKSIILVILATMVVGIYGGVTTAQEQSNKPGAVVGEIDMKDVAAIPSLPIASSTATIEIRPSFQGKAAPEQIDETRVYESSYKKCIEAGAPIDIDEYMALLLGIGEIKSPDVSQGLGGYMVCQQYLNMGKTIADTSSLKEPYFKKGVGSLGIKLTDEQKKNGEEKIKDIQQQQLQDLFVLYVLMREKTFLGKPLAEGGCGMAPEKRRAECIKNVEMVMTAVTNNDDSLCSKVDEKALPGGGDMCTIMTTKDSGMCRIKGFLYPLPYELCSDFVTMSLALSGEVEDVNKLQLSSDNIFFKAVLDEIKTKDKCKTYFEKNVLPGYCEWKGNAEVSSEITKYLEESNKVAEENAKLKKEVEEKFKKEQEELLKKEHEEKEKANDNQETSEETE